MVGRGSRIKMHRFEASETGSRRAIIQRRHLWLGCLELVGLVSMALNSNTGIDPKEERRPTSQILPRILEFLSRIGQSSSLGTKPDISFS